MPSLTINATTEQLQRVQAALGLTTGAEVKQWVINTIKREVKAAELNQVIKLEDVKVQQSLDAKQNALETKQAEPDVELT